MYDVSSIFLDKIRQSSRRVRGKLLLGDVELTYEDIITMDMEYSLGNDNIPAIGGAVSSRLNVKLLKKNLPPVITTQELRPYLGIETAPGTIEYVPMGVFRVSPQDVKKTDKTVSIVGYDQLYALEDTPYTTDLTFPATWNNIKADLETKGFKFKAQSLPNVTIKTKPDTIRELLSDIAELLGRNVVSNRLGEIEFRGLNTVEFDLDASNYIDFKLLADDDVKITRLTVEKEGEENENLTYGDDTGYTIKIKNDSITTQNELRTAYDRVFPLSYTAYECNMQGMPHIDVGDIIKLTDRHDVVRNIPIVYHKISYTGGLRSEIKAGAPSGAISSTGSTGSNSITQSLNDLRVNILEVNYLLADKASINDLKANTARIDDLYATKANIVDLRATNARVDTLEASYANIDELEARVANIDTILAKEVFTELASVGQIVAGSSIIADGAIGDAQISSLTAGKIVSGTIDTSLVTVAGADGKLNITGNRLQVINDGKERVALGDVNRDGTVYGLRVRGQDGQTVLFDERGLTREGLTDGAVDDSKVDDSANIQGHKLDINSVIREINIGDEVIKGTRVQVGDRSLDVELSTMRSSIGDNAQELSTQRSQIQALDESIGLKVDKQEFREYKTTNDNRVTTIDTQLSKNTSAISLLQDEIALKVTQADIDRSIDKIEVGGRNLIPNSKEGNVHGYPQNPIWTMNGEWIRASLPLKDCNEILENKFVDVLPDTTYTQSLYFRTDADEISFSFTFWARSVGYVTVPTKIYYLGDNLYRAVGTGKTKPNQVDMRVPDIKTINIIGGTFIEFAYAKLERGTKATDWTPAPEDFQHKIDKTNTRISTAESSITQLKDNIELKVDTSEYNDRMRLIDNNIERLETNVVTNSSNISVLQDEVATKVSQSDIDKITIGARNLLTDSQTDIGFYPNKKGSGQARLMLDSRVPYYKVTADTNVDLCIAFPGNRFLEPLNELGEITVSLEVKTDTDDTVTFENRQFDVKANTWTKIYVTKTFGENKTEIKRVLTPFNRKQYRYIDLATKLIEQLKISGNTLYYRNLQFEKGNKPTDWQPAPEEIKRELSYNSSEIKQTAERVDIRFQSGDFPLKGTNYSFDIDNFTIGGTGKDIVKHDNKRSVYLHEDGSYTEISAKGLYRYDAGIGREYHHITKIIKFTAGGDNVAPTTRWIPLGPEFNGKDWTVALSISDSTQASSAQAAIHRIVLTQSVTADGKTIQPRYRNGQWEFPVMGYKTNINVFEDTRRYGDIAGIMIVTA